MKTDFSSLFNDFLAKINWYTNLLVKICEPLSDLEKSKAKDELIKLCGKLPAPEKSKITKLLKTVSIPLSGKRSEVEDSLGKICESLPEPQGPKIASLLTKICEPLSDLEKGEIYESFILKICATWETFIEDLLALCLGKDTCRYSQYIGTKFPKRLPKELCATLISGYRYFDFKNVDGLKGISKNILVAAYDPFSKIPRKESKKIDEFFLIRNYVAHRSRVAKRSLSRLYREVYHLREFQEPGAFLLLPLHEKTKEVHFGEYIQAFIHAAKVMALHLKVYKQEE